MESGEISLTTSKSLAERTPTAHRMDFEEVFQAYWRKVLQVVFYLLRDWDDAEDICQQVFIKYSYQEKKGEIRNPGGWLYRTATNLSYNHNRDQMRRKQKSEYLNQNSH